MTTIESTCCSQRSTGELADAVDAPALDEQTLRRVVQDGMSLARAKILDHLGEQHAIFEGASSARVTRIRGALLLALAQHHGCARALPFVLEELENAHDPYLTAVAACTLRSSFHPEPAFVEPLLSAYLYIRNRDAGLRLGTYGGYGDRGPRTTASREILRSLGWLGSAGRDALPRLRELQAEASGETARSIIEAIRKIEAAGEPPAACCCAQESAQLTTAQQDVTEIGFTQIRDVELEDQDGRRLRFGEFFRGKPSIVVFFYTRCENPSKCPKTVTRLGNLQRRLRSEGLADVIRTAAITYDPDFDQPPRLEQFRRSWGAEAHPDHRMLRTVSGFAPLRDYFTLGVNYVSRSGTSVNRHRLETYLLDPTGRICSTVTRRHWNEDALLEAARSLLSANALSHSAKHRE